MEQYTREVIKAITDRITGDYEVSSTISKKNNGTELTGIIIRDSNRNKVEPVIYITDYYKHGISAEETAEAVLGKYRDVKESGMPSFDVRDITNFDIIKSRIRAKVINMEMNDAYLEDKPYLQIADDLAVCFYVDINNDASATIPITFALADVWGIDDANTLFYYADANHRPAELVTMAEAILGTMSEMDFQMMKIQSGNEDLSDAEFKEFLLEAQSGLVPMYVWRDSATLGASAMIFKDNVQEVLDKLGGEFYILPSSVHELIVLPYSPEYTVEDLKQMIMEVNASQLQPDEVLSEHPYFVNQRGEILVAQDEEPEHQFTEEAR